MISEEAYLNQDVVHLNKWSNQIVHYTSEVGEIFSKYALEGYPNEICGFMYGYKRDHIEVVEVYQVKNEAKVQSRMFSIHPLDYLAAEKYAFNKGFDLIGVFHSHPNYPAIPSPTDLEYAQSDFSYIIISIQENGISKISSWVIENHKFINQKIQIN